jgi:hypothetical protein
MSWKVIGQTAESLKYKVLQEFYRVNALIDWASLKAKLSGRHAGNLSQYGLFVKGECYKLSTKKVLHRYV